MSGPASTPRQKRREATKSNSTHPTKSTTRPRRVERIDSGFDAASVGSSITFIDEVERRYEMQEFLHRKNCWEGMEGEEVEEEEGEEEEEEEDEGETVGRRARDSIDMNIERAWSWENKEKRTKRNQGGTLKAVGSWLKKITSGR